MTDDKPFAPGDVVQLKSGGPKMTVEDVRTGDEGEKICRCVWFQDGERDLADFKATSLVKVQ